MQLERCGLHYKQSHFTETCRLFLVRFPDDTLPASPEDSSDEDAEDEDEEEDEEEDGEDEEDEDDEDNDSGDDNNAVSTEGDVMYPNLIFFVCMLMQ